MIGEYFIGIVTASVAVTLVSMLYPESGGVRRTLDLFLSLCLLCVILAPLGTMIAKARDEIDFDIFDDITAGDIAMDDAVYNSLAEASRIQIEEKLTELFLERFGGEIEVRVDVSAEGGQVKLTRVILTLYGNSMWEDPRELREFARKYTDAEILIVNGG
ncbi:MAG: hypothetical protein ACI3XI_08230 [Eubacteriales bacterium]